MERRDRVLRKIDELAPMLVEMSRRLYDDPELSNEEFRAVQRLTAVAMDHRFTVEHPVAGLPTAFRATFRGAPGARTRSDTSRSAQPSVPTPDDASPSTEVSRGAGVSAPEAVSGPTVAFLAEYDALPEIGHACGHNLIAASCLGAALALQSLGTDLPGNVILIGCPAEETTGGKVTLVEAGAFDDVDVAMSVHPGQRDAIGGSSRASHPLEIEFLGRPSHAASAPAEGLNALHGLVLALQAIWALRSQLRDDVRLPGIILDGGSAPNVIPEYARARLSLRAADADYLRDVVVPRVRAAAEGAALATGTQVVCRHYEPLYKDLRQNNELSHVFKRQLESLGRRDIEIRSPERRGGSTDVGNVSYVVPTIHPTVAIVPAGKAVSAHTPEFAEATISPSGLEGMLAATRAMALTALEYMLDPELQKRVQGEFNAWAGAGGTKGDRP